MNIFQEVLDRVTNRITGTEVKTQGVLDAGWNAAFPGEVPPGGADVEVGDFGTALTSIPNTNVGGIGGPGDIGASMQTTWDYMVSGFRQDSLTDQSLADVAAAASEISTAAQQAKDLAEANAAAIGLQYNAPSHWGLDGSTECTIPLASLQGSSAPLINVTQTNAVMGFLRCTKPGIKSAISWYGQSTASITAAYLTIYKMDATGLLTKVYESVNIVALLSNSMAKISHTLTTPLTYAAEDRYFIELAVRGAGTYQVAGITQTWLPADPSLYPKMPGARRNSGVAAAPSTIAAGTVDYYGLVPAFYLTVSATEVVPPVYHAPTLDTKNTAGAYSWTVPSWAATGWVDIIQVSGGGGGCGGFAAGNYGAGGGGGQWQVTSLHVGIDVAVGANITGTVGAGGIKGPAGVVSGAGAYGQAGGATTAIIPSYGTITSTGGAAGIGGSQTTPVAPPRNGQSPGNVTVNGVIYYGGATQTANHGNGNGPGGGGAGDAGGFYWGGGGGTGAPGAIWIIARQA